MTHTHSLSHTHHVTSRIRNVDLPFYRRQLALEHQDLLRAHQNFVSRLSAEPLTVWHQNETKINDGVVLPMMLKKTIEFQKIKILNFEVGKLSLIRTEFQLNFGHKIFGISISGTACYTKARQADYRRDTTRCKRCWQVYEHKNILNNNIIKNIFALLCLLCLCKQLPNLDLRQDPPWGYFSHLWS